MFFLNNFTSFKIRKKNYMMNRFEIQNYISRSYTIFNFTYKFFE